MLRELLARLDSSAAAARLHAWEEFQLNKPTFCAGCQGFIWGVGYKQALRCRCCLLAIHPTCLQSFNSHICQPVSSSSLPASSSSSSSSSSSLTFSPSSSHLSSSSSMSLARLVRGNQHAWVRSWYKTARRCSHCQTLIWGLQQQAHECSRCHLTVHAQCRARLHSHCSSADGEPAAAPTAASDSGDGVEDERSGHQVQLQSFTIRQRCGVCDGYLWGGQTGGACLLCPFVCHEACLSAARASCLPASADAYVRSAVLPGFVYTRLPALRVCAESPYDDTYNAGTALWLVAAACLAYEPPPLAEAVARSLWGMTAAFACFDDAATDTHAIGMCNDDVVVLAFRGTRSLTNWKTNVDHAHEPFSTELPDVGVHRGFNRACAAVLPAVERWLLEVGGSDKSLYIGGHSLGGALATLCFARLTLRDQPVAVNGVVTIGQPRVGTARLGQELLRRAPAVLQRIFHANDVVPNVPPAAAGYVHVGQRIWFNSHGELVRNPPESLGLAQARVWMSGQSGIASHDADKYFRCVERHARRIAQMSDGALDVFKLTVTIDALELPALDPDADAIDPDADFHCLVRGFDSVDRSPPARRQPDQPLRVPFAFTFTVADLLKYHQYSIEVWTTRRSRPYFVGQHTGYCDQLDNFSQLAFDLLPQPSNAHPGVDGARLVLSSQFIITKKASCDNNFSVQAILHGTTGIPKSNTYGLVSFGATAKRTPVAATVNPCWDCRFAVHCAKPGDRLAVQIFQKGAKKDAALGQCVIEFDENCAGGSREAVPLSAVPGQLDDVVGAVVLSLQFAPIERPGLAVAAATITIHSAVNLKVADVGGSSDPYVIVKLAGATVFRTATVSKNLNPVWEASFTVDRLLANAPLVFELWDEDFMSPDDFLGQVVFSQPAFYDITREFFAVVERSHHDQDITGELCLSFAFSPLNSASSESIPTIVSIPHH